MTTTTLNAFISPYKIFSQSTTQLLLPKGRWVVLYDNKLKNISKKIKGSDLVFFSIAGGEKAKDIQTLLKILSKLSKIEEGGSIEGLCVVGGGSLGDLGAFAASIYKRGVRLLQVPTTYLSVIDSAFGGKTAVNYSGAKNQIGTFYPAENVYLVPKFLSGNLGQLRDSFAEILKMAILKRGLWQKISKVDEVTEKAFWKLADATIQAKLEIVHRDPFEKKGERKLLNLGHTFGHVFEKLAQLSHGEAVALGLCLELEYFVSVKKLKAENYLEIIEVWEKFFNYKDLRKKLGKHSLKKASVLLSKDKKVLAQDVVSAVVYEVGKVKLEKLKRKDLLLFLKREGILS